jgi:hypothetical protein
MYLMDENNYVILSIFLPISFNLKTLLLHADIFKQSCYHDCSFADMLSFNVQVDFEEFLKQRLKETVIASQKQAELISR